VRGCGSGGGRAADDELITLLLEPGGAGGGDEREDVRAGLVPALGRQAGEVLEVRSEGVVLTGDVPGIMPLLDETFARTGGCNS
jgi:hypothetical protein